MTANIFQPIIELLQDIAHSTAENLDRNSLHAAVETLDEVKDQLDGASEDIVDLVDEVQDYLEYLIHTDEPLLDEEFREELAEVISDLKSAAKTEQ